MTILHTPARPFSRPRRVMRIGLVGALFALAAPASAQLSVFDPTNYSQNLLTAARSLSQVNNQVRMLQNQAQGLVNQARNLSKIGFPEMQSITTHLQQIDRLMAQAKAIEFKADGLGEQFERLFPQASGSASTGDQRVASARARLHASIAAFRETMGVQSEVVTGIAADGGVLRDIIGRSQGAEGALQATQATNQLLALAAKQQFQIQHLMAAQYRAEAIEQARRTQAEGDARAATRRFLGSGLAYPPR